MVISCGQQADQQTDAGAGTGHIPWMLLNVFVGGVGRVFYFFSQVYFQVQHLVFGVFRVDSNLARATLKASPSGFSVALSKFSAPLITAFNSLVILSRFFSINSVPFMAYLLRKSFNIAFDLTVIGTCYTSPPGTPPPGFGKHSQLPPTIGLSVI
jgi:hypothetical protein